MVEAMEGALRAIEMLDLRAEREEWIETLRALVDRETIHGLVRGWCCRALFERQAIEADTLQRLAGLALSRAVSRAEAAAWLEGLLRGSGLLLVHQDGVWTALDHWLLTLAPEEFPTVLPLLRRAFANFSDAERRVMGDKVKRLVSGAGGANASRDRAAHLDHERAARVLPVLAHLLGVPEGGRA
jgi:hypothetical protein